MTNQIPKKILYIHHGKGLGGAPLSLLYLVKNLDKTKFHPIVLFLHQSEVIDLYKKHGIEIVGPIGLYDFPHTKIWWFKWYHLPYLLRSIKDMIKTYYSVAPYWINTIKPDLIHLNTSSLIAWAAVAHKKNIPVIWHIREPLAQGYFGIRRWLIKKGVEKFASAILPICKNDAQPWINNAKTHIIYNAVDQRLFDFNINPNHFLEKHKLNPNTPKILFLGGLSKEKGTLLILKFFETLLKKIPEAQLLIAGYFDLSSQTPFIKKFFPAYHYRKKVFQCFFKIKNNIILLGPSNEIPEAIAASNIIVFPATKGHFARPIIEAGFMKKPVIASNLAPLNELVIHEKTGYLIDQKNITIWTKQLAMLCQNREKAKAIGEAAYHFCLKNFELTNQLHKIGSIYQHHFLNKKIKAEK